MLLAPPRVRLSRQTLVAAVVVLALPVGDRGAVVVPLVLLLLHQVIKDVVAQDLAHELGLLEVLDGLAQGARQTLDAPGLELLLAEKEGVARGLLGQGQLLLDALEAGGDGGGQR